MYGTRQQTTVATIHSSKGQSSSYKGKLKPVASPQPPPDYQLTVRKPLQKELYRPESSAYQEGDSYMYCSTTSSYVTTTDQSSSRSSSTLHHHRRGGGGGWRDQITDDAVLMPATTSRYMRDYMEYSTEKRKRRDERTVTAADGRGDQATETEGRPKDNLRRT